MVLFTSMSTVTLYTCVTVAVLVWYGTGRSPLRTLGTILKELVTSRKYLIHFAAVIGILMSNKYELRLEAILNTHLDFTKVFQELEGGFVGGLQHLFVTPWLTPILAFMYVVVFQSLLIASLAIYSHRSDKRMFYTVCYAVLINYAAALPFYLFFPVQEVWSYDPTVRFVMLDAFPTFETQYRALSGIDNCFPSLHTSISVTLAILAYRSGNRRWTWFTGASAAIIIFTIFYMGIHWLTDSLGGVALGLFASAAAMRISAQPLSQRGRIPGVAAGYSRESGE